MAQSQPRAPERAFDARDQTARDLIINAGDNSDTISAVSHNHSLRSFTSRISNVSSATQAHSPALTTKANKAIEAGVKMEERGFGGQGGLLNHLEGDLEGHAIAVANTPNPASPGTNYDLRTAPSFPPSFHSFEVEDDPFRDDNNGNTGSNSYGSAYGQGYGQSYGYDYGDGQSPGRYRNTSGAYSIVSESQSPYNQHGGYSSIPLPPTLPQDSQSALLHGQSLSTPPRQRSQVERGLGSGGATALPPAYGKLQRGPSGGGMGPRGKLFGVFGSRSDSGSGSGSRTASSTWTRIWRSSWKMFLFAAMGLGCAIGHHAFYSSLDGHPAEAQLQMLRYGTLLAFAAKAGLSASVVASYRVRVWTTVRTRLLSVAAIDSMFAATEDLAAMVNWEMISQAKVVTALALFVWLAPLVVILTANTLLVELRTINEAATCPGVRTLNFTFEDINDWRKPVRIDSLFEIPLSLWNTTRPSDSEPEGWFDYYTGPSPNFAQTATIGAFLEGVNGRKNASMEICSSGWNCTFEIAFTAPGYKCTELASGVGSTPRNLTQESGLQAKAPFGTDILLPRGQFAYYAFNTGGEYSSTQMKEVVPGGIPTTPPPYPRNMGAFRTEPIIWIGHSVVARPNEPLPSSPSDPKWDSAFVPKMFACEHYEASYKVLFNYTDGGQFTAVRERKFLAPVVNTTFIPGVKSNDGTADNTTARPESNFVFPQDVARYRRTAAYHSMGYMVRAFLNGTIEMRSESASLVNPIANTDAIQTKLLDRRSNYIPYPNLMDLVQGFYEDIILSMFSNPQFTAVVWASRPAEQSGDRTSGEAAGDAGRAESEYRFPCTRSRTANLYSYHARDLWIVYGIAVLLALLGVSAGVYATVWEERHGGRIATNTRFSSIAASTRGPALDAVPWAGEVGAGAGAGGSVPRSVMAVRMGYGRLLDGRQGAAMTGEGDDSLAYGEGGRGAGSGLGSGSPTSLSKADEPPRYGFGLEGAVKQPPR